MKTQPIRPARLQLDGDGVVRAPDFDDVYAPRAGAGEQARQVYLQGNGLPARWAGRHRFVVLETGFGLGNNFLATWQAWRDDPQRCERLVFVSIDRHPPTRDDLARVEAAASLGGPCALVAQLLSAWPPLTPNLHPLAFEQGRVRLLLGWGDVAQMLPQLALQFDALFLDGFAPARNPAMWDARLIKALGRRAAAGATVATWSAAPAVRDALASVGFDVKTAPGVGGRGEMTTGRFAPRFQARGALPGNTGASASTAEQRSAVVVGAGLAGAWVAHELAALGWQVTVLDRHSEPATETSGNPAGLFHGTVHEGDGSYSRLFRAAALLAQRRLQPWIDGGQVPGQVHGLLRLVRRPDTATSMNATLIAQGLPADYVQALSAAQARARAGVPLSHAAWWYPGGGWIAPPALVRHLLQTPGVRFMGGIDVAQLKRSHGGWQLLDPHQTVLAESAVVVLAHAAQALSLAGARGADAWPMQRIRGQVTVWRGVPGTVMPLAIPVAGDGYALPLPGGDMLCGATSSEGEDDDPVRDSDHLRNLERFERLTGLQGFSGPSVLKAGGLEGRVGWRLQAADRLPIVGPVPMAMVDWPAGRHDQVRLVPRLPGLHVATAFGARGLTLAPLAAAWLAALIDGEPLPLENDLAEAIDPARWQVRRVRREP